PSRGPTRATFPLGEPGAGREELGMSRRVSARKRKQARPPLAATPTPAWKAFEQLVARIEHQVAPKGAVVRSPDRLPDRHTGQLREVDASIRFTVGTVPLLITFECRKRSR